MYDKNGNRTRYHKNVGIGQATNYTLPMDLSYTFNNVNALTAISDADDANYTGSVTCDANGNITEIMEEVDNSGNKNYFYTYFTLDALNQVTDYKHKWYDSAASAWQWSKRAHGYDVASARPARRTPPRRMQTRNREY